MSASREKKNRQELAASGAPDPKKIRQEEEQRKQHRSSLLYGAIAALFVLVAAAVLVWNSNVIQRNATALTADGVKYSAAEVDYYYHNSFNSLLQSSYASYMGLTSSTDRSTNLNDMAKMLLKQEEDISWDDYLKNTAKRALAKSVAIAKLADEDGYAFTDEMQKELDDAMQSLSDGAANAGMSRGGYLKALYGNNMTLSTFERILKRNILVSHYEDDYVDGLTYSDADIESYYEENRNDLDVVSYESIYFTGSASSTTDADGNTVEPSEEEQEAAKTAAKAAADEALARYQEGEALEDIAADYDIATYSKNESATYSASVLNDWLFSADRAADDTEVLESDPNYYLAVFHSRERNAVGTVDVRHILFKADTSALDTESDSYEADSAAIWAEAATKADAALAQWKNGDATEDSFAALANELSEDGGSSSNGGLYEQVAPGDMVTAFNDWIFDESRQAGDTGVVQTEYGYHVMYFVGKNDALWRVQAVKALRDADEESWNEELVAGVELVEASGMKYVG